MLRMLTALLTGLFLGGLGLEALTDTTGIAWIWPTTLPLLILSATLTMIGRALRGVTPPLSPAVTGRLLDRNLGAVARVTGIKRTGTTVNESPLCELTVIVAPTDAETFRTTLRMLVTGGAPGSKAAEAG